MDRWLQLSLLMPEDGFITNKQLAEALGASNRTVYSNIVQLNQVMRDKGAQLVSKPHYGYGVKLEVTVKGKYLAFLLSLQIDTATVGDNMETRVNKIIGRVIQADAPIKMDGLSGELYVSRSTLKNDLKRARTILDGYGLQIDYRSYNGMRVNGPEKDLRRCLAKIEQYLTAKDGIFLSKDMDDVSALLKEVFKRHRYNMAACSFHNFITHIYVSISRSRQGKEIAPVYPERHECDPRVRSLAEDVAAALERAYDVAFSRPEFQHLLLPPDAEGGADGVPL